jgi:two-component system OmpR family response regulator
VSEGRVLVVDDEHNITDLVGTALRYVGFEVATASSGREALETARTFRPEIIVLDVMMPDLDGFEVTRRLRGEGLRIPVLFLTARDATEDKVAGLTIGGDDYVT